MWRNNSFNGAGVFVHGAARRAASTAPIKRYKGLRTPVAEWWHRQLSPSAKYFGGILAAAATVSHVHHDVLVTVAPPLAVATFVAMRAAEKAAFSRAVEVVRPRDASGWADDDTKVRVWHYDEADVATAARGIENPYDHFQEQLVPMVERRVVDYVAAQEQRGAVTAVTRLLVDENKQVAVHMGAAFETFVTVQADVVDGEGRPEVVGFVRWSVPYYTSKKALRRRLGVAEVSMLEVPGVGGGGYTDYRVWVELTPRGYFRKTEGFGAVAGGLMSSRLHEPAHGE